MSHQRQQASTADLSLLTTVLTRRAAKCILRFLPNELLTEIIANAAPADQVALCRVSKLFNRLARRVLYRTLALASPRAVLTCCHSLVSNTELALLVKSFDISASKLDGYRIYDAIDLISATLACTANIEALTLVFACGAPSFIECIDSRTFPALRRLVLRADLDAEPALLAFLQRHPRIGVLKLFGPAASFAALLSATGVPCLPDLKYLKATAAVFPALLEPGGGGMPPHLTGAEISWKLADPLDPLPPLRALTAYSASLTKLVCYRPGPNLDLIALVAQHLPRLAVLKITAPSDLLLTAHDAVGRSFPTSGFTLTLPQETLTTIRTALARLSALRVFHYTYAHFAHRVHDRATVAWWAADCPALRQCTLNGVIWKWRVATREWRCVKKC
ncbi:hypothetical protein C8J57DRAFT_1556055 [Mycena rebaudengoi]|nr:hypothetical protein C8J57DRAFT_1556055 [Mycena rebaudengoi]